MLNKRLIKKNNSRAGDCQKITRMFLALILLILAGGIFLILDISIVEAQTNFGDPLYFVKRQAVWIAISLAAAAVFAKTNLEKIRSLSSYFWLLSIALLILVLIPGLGVEIWGAKRWLTAGGIYFQPSEFAKLSILIYLAFVLGQEGKKNLKDVLVIVSPALLLILIQPDFGTAAIITAVSLSLYFLAGGNLKKILLLSGAIALVGAILIAVSPYRRNRVASLIDPFNDPMGKSYHSYQTVLALASGGTWGQGIGGSRQKYQYLPQVTTDSIMAVVGEEVGFVGLTIFTIFLLLISLLCFKIAAIKTDPPAKLIAGGVGAWIAIQGLVNLSSTAILFPFTGVPFPFVSYGGSSLLSIMAAVGLVLNVGHNRQ